MTQILFTTIGYNTWTVPSDWNNSNNYFEVIAGGGSGTNEPCGGGGGGYASSNNLTCIPGQTIYIFVGDAGKLNFQSETGVAGQNTWINIISNAAPTLSSQGAAANGGAGGYAGGIGQGGAGLVGQVVYNGGNGVSDPFKGGGGGGAAGPHGNGLPSPVSNNHADGGAGDAGFGGAGGINSFNYGPLTNGQNGPNHGSGGGGSYANFPGLINLDGTINDVGAGGLYGGGGGGNILAHCKGGQGIAKITYVPTTSLPALPPPPAGSPPPPCVPSGILTATPAQIYWAYGAFSDLWSGSAHYDTNYQKLNSLAGDNDTGVYDAQYNNTTLPWSFQNEKENFYTDYPRIWKSRSNEWVEDNGQKSVWMRHREIIGDMDCVPNIDNPSGYVTLLGNMLFMDEQTYGWRLSYSNTTGYFLPGDIVTQTLDNVNFVSGTVYMMDPNYIYVNIPVGPFVPGYSVYNAYNSTVNAYVTASVEMNEKYSANVFPGQSRYICKQTVLPSKAEDLQAFMTAYRPANTNFKVYGKIIAHEDPDNFKDKIWSRLAETSNSTTLYSSGVNTTDYISMVYDMPQGQLVFSNMESCSCNTTSPYVTVPTNIYFAAGEFVYLSDPSTGAFNVRQIGTMPNNSTLQLTTYPSFSNTANLNVGVIPGLEDAQGAFRYDQNSNIIRYVNESDIYFDMFDKFAIKIVPISDNPVICPTVTEFRGVALAAS